MAEFRAFFTIEKRSAKILGTIADVTHPSDVGVDPFGIIHFRPHIDQDQIPAMNDGVDLFGRAIMGLFAVRPIATIAASS
jgi:hypothetical protein